MSKIQDKKKCQNDFRNVKGLAELINNATICLRSRGSIDVNGDVVTEKPPENTRCSYRRDMNGTQNVKVTNCMIHKYKCFEFCSYSLFVFIMDI